MNDSVSIGKTNGDVDLVFSHLSLSLPPSILYSQDVTRRSGRARVISSKVAVVSEAELAAAAAARLDALEADDDDAAAALAAGAAGAGGEGGGVSDAEDFVPDDEDWEVSSEDFSDEDDEEGGGGAGARGGEAGASAAAAAAAAAARPKQQKKGGGKQQQSKKRPLTPKFGARTGARASGAGFSPKKKTRAAAAAEAATGGASGGGRGGSGSGVGGGRLSAKPFAQLLEEANLSPPPSPRDSFEAKKTKTAPFAPHWLSAAMPAPKAAARRHWCSICGFRAPYACPRCKARFCCRRCGGVHAETRCLKMVG